MGRSIVALDIETVPGPMMGAAVERMAAKREMPPEMYAALSPPLCRVVAVGLVSGGPTGDRATALVDTEPFPAGTPVPEQMVGLDGRGALLRQLATILDQVGLLVTFNGRGFDIPVLIHQYRMLDLEPPSLLQRCMDQKPWVKGGEGPHADLMLEFNFGRSAPAQPMAAYALGYGLGDPKELGDGSEVAGLVERGDATRLTEYVIGDARTTWQLWKAWTTAGQRELL